MKKIFASSVLFLIFCTAIFAQTKEVSPCPTISIKTPTEHIQPGDPIIFTVAVEDKNPQKFTHSWTVSSGTVIEGLGTPTIKVATTREMAGGSVTANAEIKGLSSANCSGIVSATVFIADSICCFDPSPIDEFGKIPLNDEKARLSFVAEELRRGKDLIAVFILYSGEKDTPQTLKNRRSRIADYLTQSHKFSKDKFMFVSGGIGEYRTVVYVVPAEIGKTFTVLEEN